MEPSGFIVGFRKICKVAICGQMILVARTQVEMADFLAMDRSYLSEIENGKKDPSLTMLKVIAEGLSISISKLTADL